MTQEIKQKQISEENQKSKKKQKRQVILFNFYTPLNQSYQGLSDLAFSKFIHCNMVSKSAFLYSKETPKLKK